MTDTLSRIRDAALALPEVEERGDDGGSTFVVADRPFVRLRGDGALCVVSGEARPGSDADASGWDTMPLSDDADWLLVEDRIAHGWELVAPRRLLEAGGR